MDCSDIQNAEQLYCLCNENRALIDGRFSMYPSFVEELHETGETPVVQEEEQVDVCAEGIPSSFPPP